MLYHKCAGCHSTPFGNDLQFIARSTKYEDKLLIVRHRKYFILSFSTRGIAWMYQLDVFLVQEGKHRLFLIFSFSFFFFFFGFFFFSFFFFFFVLWAFWAPLLATCARGGPPPPPPPPPGNASGCCNKGPKFPWGPKLDVFTVRWVQRSLSPEDRSGTRICHFVLRDRKELPIIEWRGYRRAITLLRARRSAI